MDKNFDVVTGDGELRTYMYGEEVAKEMEKGGSVDDTVNIPVGEYYQLLADSRFLECLRVGGVDSWDFYSDAIQLFEETKDDFPDQP